MKTLISLTQAKYRVQLKQPQDPACLGPRDKYIKILARWVQRLARIHFNTKARTIGRPGHQSRERDRDIDREEEEENMPGRIAASLFAVYEGLYRERGRREKNRGDQTDREKTASATHPCKQTKDRIKNQGTGVNKRTGRERSAEVSVNHCLLACSLGATSL